MKRLVNGTGALDSQAFKAIIFKNTGVIFVRRKIMVIAPAKVNLTLDVKYKRADGYHELETVMHQIDLVDRLYFEEDHDIKVASDSREIPLGEQNLVYKAAKSILVKYGIKAGVKIFIEKNIPVGAGLAGGSTDAAAALLGIDRFFSLGADPGELFEIGASLGSDVPFCLHGATALATGRGEILEAMPAGPMLTMLLVKPPYQVSTAEVYKGLALEHLDCRPDNPAFLLSWGKGDLKGIAANMINVLESVTVKKYSELKFIKDRLIDMGAMNAVMSGSGPAIIGLFKEREAADRAMTKMKKMYQQVFLVSSYVRSD